MKYEIGQEVLRATWEATESSVECPDCGGTGRMRVLLHDDTMVSIDCEGCKRGYLSPTGRIPVHIRTPRCRPEIITGVEMRDGKTEWQTNGTYRVEESLLFETEAAALVKAQEIAAVADQEERDRISQKEKPTRSWSWNVHYHRREIRDAQRRIEYHTAKLAAANLKAKDKSADAVER